MARKAKDLTVHSFISFNGPDGDYKRWEDCSEEEIQLFREETGKKLSQSASDIFNRRIAEGKPLNF